MLSVELDIFSGRPNPSWILTEKDEKELLDRLIAEPALMRPVSASPNRLGYRGYIISRLDEEEDSGKKKTKFPTRFRLGSSLEGAEQGTEASLWLLDTSEQLDTEVDDYLREVARDSILHLEPQRSEVGPENLHEKTGMSCVSNYLTSSTDFSFWNGSSYYQANNNCYNFASNKRTNTYAQPGRMTGKTWTPPPTCSSITAAIKSDGWAASCRSSNNLSICLVIWPGKDFHFYRLCSGGRWCHKIGWAPAKNTDESGKFISNPQTCNRGSYTQFCDYWFADNSVIKVL